MTRSSIAGNKKSFQGRGAFWKGLEGMVEFLNKKLRQGDSQAGIVSSDPGQQG